MVDVNWTDQSLEDIDSIAEFIAKDSPRYANIQVEGFLKERKSCIIIQMPDG